MSTWGSNGKLKNVLRDIVCYFVQFYFHSH